MKPKISIVTLGVEDLDRATRCYLVKARARGVLGRLLRLLPGHRGPLLGSGLQPVPGSDLILFSCLNSEPANCGCYSRGS